MSIKNEFIYFCKQLYQKEFVSALDGNVSVKLDANKILITPSAKCKGLLTEEDLLIVDNDGNLLEGNGKVSTEFKLHKFAYDNRPDIKSVIHAHPIYATAFAAMGEELVTPVFPEVVLNIGKVHLCKYATPSTKELAESMKPFIEYAWVLLLENHGAISFGTSLSDAYYKLEKLEHTAKILSVVRAMGQENIIPGKKLKELYLIAESTYNIKVNPKNRMDK